MKLIVKLLIIVCCFLFSVSAKAKTYTNDEMKISMWMPEEMEIISDQHVNFGNCDGRVLRAEYLGLNLSLQMGNCCNVEGQEFNNYEFANRYLEVAKQTTLSFGLSAETYCIIPMAKHYYATTLRKKDDNSFCSGELMTTIHGRSFILTCNGKADYLPVIREIMESFSCVEEQT